MIFCQFWLKGSFEVMISLDLMFKVMILLLLDSKCFEVATCFDFLFKVMILANFGIKVANFLKISLLK